MNLNRICFIILILTLANNSWAQVDSVLQNIQNIPIKFIKQADKKIDRYTNRITNKTERTLTKLSRWENNIHKLLEKVNPEVSQRLFAVNQLSFTKALEKYKKGENIITDQRAKYDEYKDKLTTSLAYLQEQKDKLDKKIISKLKAVNQKSDGLKREDSNCEAIQQFIKERKRQLQQEALKYLAKSKYLQKINKESFYYTETLRNYKEIFSNPKKTEETAKNILNKIPLFQKFMQENSMLAKLFGNPGSSTSGGGGTSLVGLQTRASVSALIQTRIAAGGPNARDAMQQNIQQAQAELTKLKDKILKAGGGNSDAELPDFKPNMQKTKTFKQRLEYGFDFQSLKKNSLIPGAFNLGLSIGYKLNDKSVVGVGVGYKLGVGSIEKIRFSSVGIGIRSYMDWKLKKQFFVSGGFEMNYLPALKNFPQVSTAGGDIEGASWQQSGLLGISKKMELKSKLMKGGKLQLLYDFLYRQHLPVSQPVVFRVGHIL